MLSFSVCLLTVAYTQSQFWLAFFGFVSYNAFVCLLKVYICKFFNSLDLWVCNLTFDFLFSVMSEEPVHEAILSSPWKYGFLIQNPQQPLLITLLYFLGRCPDLKVKQIKIV